MPVFYNTTTTASAKATVPRFVTCEKCGHGYGYLVTRTGYGFVYSHWGLIDFGRPDRVQGDADVELEKKLRNAVEAVPCPKCGWYQKHMLARAREERFGWILWAGLAGGFVGGGAVAGVVGALEAVLARHHHAAGVLPLLGMAKFLTFPAVMVAASLGGFFLRNYLYAHYKPNDADVEERKERGRERALSPKQYARVVPKGEAKGTNQKLRLEDLE